jgi:hypothetical protein
MVAALIERSGCVATIPEDCKWLQIKVVWRSSLIGENTFPEEDKGSESFKLARQDYCALGLKESMQSCGSYSFVRCSRNSIDFPTVHEEWTPNEETQSAARVSETTLQFNTRRMA